MAAEVKRIHKGTLAHQNKLLRDALQEVADDLKRWREQASGQVSEPIRLQVQTYEDRARSVLAKVKG